jgi:hypothetical protein
MPSNNHAPMRLREVAASAHQPSGRRTHIGGPNIAGSKPFTTAPWVMLLINVPRLKMRSPHGCT